MAVIQYAGDGFGAALIESGDGTPETRPQFLLEQ